MYIYCPYFLTSNQWEYFNQQFSVKIEKYTVQLISQEKYSCQLSLLYRPIPQNIFTKYVILQKPLEKEHLDTENEKEIQWDVTSGVNSKIFTKNLRAFVECYIVFQKYMNDINDERQDTNKIMKCRSLKRIGHILIVWFWSIKQLENLDYLIEERFYEPEKYVYSLRLNKDSFLDPLTNEWWTEPFSTTPRFINIQIIHQGAKLFGEEQSDKWFTIQVLYSFDAGMLSTELGIEENLLSHELPKNFLKKAIENFFVFLKNFINEKHNKNDFIELLKLQYDRYFSILVSDLPLSKTNESIHTILQEMKKFFWGVFTNSFLLFGGSNSQFTKETFK